jgi:uncharacterized protein YndB with AHSA1/START domain
MTAMNVTLQGDTQVIVTRRFAAAPARLWAAHTDPALMQRWLTGPDGWVMTQCHCDARPGGSMRCDWAPADGSPGAFHLTAEFLEVEPITRMVHVERMFLPDAATREAMLATGMEPSYARFERMELA